VSLLLAVVAALVTICLFLAPAALAFAEGARPLGRAVGWALGLLGGAAAVTIARWLLLEPSVPLVLDPHGLWLGPEEHVPWSDVVGADLRRGLLPPRRLLRLRIRGGGARELRVSGLSLRPRQLLREIEVRAAAARPDSSGAAARERGQEHVRAGRLESALAAFTQALEDEPENPSSLFERGLAFAARGDLERAEADLSEAIRLRPQSVPLFRERGRVRLEAGQPLLAIEDLTRAIELRPDADLLRERARAHAAAGHVAEAAADLALAAATETEGAKSVEGDVGAEEAQAGGSPVADPAR
jgi:tetratricopeptide (TPR) repeat protein